MLLLACLSASRSAQAQPSRVLFTVVVNENETKELGAVAAELLERLQLEVELERVERIDVGEIRKPPARSRTYFARVWIAFAPSGRARLYLEHAATDRVLVREVEGNSQNPELVREEIGHIVQAALEGLKAGEEVGTPRNEALLEEEPGVPSRPPLPPPAASTRPAPRTARRPWRFGPRYELIYLGDGGHFEDGPGATLGLTLARSRWGVELGAFLHRPWRIERNPVGARLQSVTAAALATFEVWHEAPGRLRLGAGVEASFVRVSPFAASGSDVRLAENRWLSLALARVGATYAHRLAGWFELELTLGAELDPSEMRLVVERSSGPSTVLAPWPVRPLLSVGGTVP
jgi:hypothetical protein